MRHLTIVALAAATAAPLFAQSNAVPGMDAQIYNVYDVGYFGRRGAAYPNGEAGFGVGHSYCNSGTVNIPWVASSGGVMIDTYPKIAFMLARERDGRMVQVSGRSHAKHSRAVFNFSSGPCAPCTTSGGGFFFRGCSDTYSSGINSNRFDLGPTTEINPWLGTWDSVGSYFDRGDPAVAGTAATDRVQSLTSTQTAAFDSVKNRVEVRESEIAGGGNFFGQVHLMIQGEPVTNRGNNIMSRPCTITWNGTAWTSGATGTALNGTVLNQWQGATVNEGGNGADDGRFAVGVKVTGPVNGLWHYEYAVHNLDNSRGGASLRIPVDAGATVANFGFRDIDADALNQWTATRTGTEIAFTASSLDNAIEWNTIYNFWFDCSVAPSFGIVNVDQGRVGPGNLSVAVASEVPSGIPSARVQSVGSSCGSCANSFYELFGSSGSFDLQNRSVGMQLTTSQYLVTMDAPTWIAPTGTPLTLSDDSDAAITLPFSLPYPGGTTTTLRVCSNGYVSVATGNGNGFTASASGFLTGVARWAGLWRDLNPSAGGQVLVDSTASRVVVSFVNVANFGAAGATNTFQYQFFPNGDANIAWQTIALAGGAPLVGFSPGAGATDSGSRDLSNSTAFTLCPGVFTGVSLGASARPILGTNVALTISGIRASAPWAVLAMSTQQATPPVDLTASGMEGCQSHVIGGWTYFYIAPSGSAVTNLSIPNNPVFLALPVISQGFVWDPGLTTLGAIATNAQLLTLGL
jgi:hypothetical protein